MMVIFITDVKMPHTLLWPVRFVYKGRLSLIKAKMFTCIDHMPVHFLYVMQLFCYGYLFIYILVIIRNNHNQAILYYI